MSFLRRLSSRAWMIVPIGAIGFLAWTNGVRVQRVEAISLMAGGDALVTDADSPTGYAGGVRRLLIVDHTGNSYPWIAQTQQVLATGEVRLRRVSYDNAPVGREVRTASPYRWWLAGLASLDHTLTGAPWGAAVERMAVWADPLLHGLLLAGAAGFAAWRFGAWAGALVAVGVAGLFPLAGAFVGGRAEDQGLGLAWELGSVLLLLAGCGEADPPRRRAGWFFAAGAAGAIGLWVDLAGEWPLLVGIGVGGLLAAWAARRADAKAAPISASLPWRLWALGGAITTMAAYLLENFPDRLGELRLDAIHPLWGIAWLGAGELLARATGWIDRSKGGRSWCDLAMGAWGLLALASVPAVALATKQRGLWSAEGFAQLTPLRGGVTAENSLAWLLRDGMTVMGVATMLPVLVVAAAAWWWWSAGVARTTRPALALAFGPAAVALGCAILQLRWWATFDATLIALLAVAAGDGAKSRTGGRWPRWVGAGALGLAVVTGAVLLPARGAASLETVTQAEIEALVERDLAYWLANRAGPAGTVVLAPPNVTASLVFHGGLRGLGTPYSENPDGFAAAVRIAGASSPDEARALMNRREVTHIVMPSWDGFLDEYARLGGGRAEHSLIGLLHQWLPPRWLRPVAYQLPNIAGFEGQSVAVFEVVELQDNVTALCRLAEYFSEMGLLDQAAAAGQALARLFPDEPMALLARAEVAMACGERAAFAETLKNLEPRLADLDLLPWDARVNLAVVLAEGKRFELAREQVRRCLADADEARLRTLSVVALYRLQRLAKAFGTAMPEPRLHALARSLLPPELREGL